MGASHRSAGIKLLALGLILGVLAGFTLGWYLKPLPPSTPTIHVKFTLDWAYQGPQAPFLVALYKGFFAEEGLSVTIDRGYGSARAVSDVASGLFDIGFGDFNSLVEFKSKNPDAKVKMVAVIHVKSPLSVVTLKDSGITTPKDLEGRRLGAPAGDAARRVFPAYANAVGIKQERITWVTMDVALREVMLARGDVDAVTGFYYTCVLNLLSLNISENNIVVFRYDEYLPLVGNGILVNEDFLKKNPEAVKKFLKAVVRGFKYVIQNPDEAIDILMQRDPTLNKAVERKRLLMALEIINVKGITDRYGFGYVDPSIIEKDIEAIASAFGLSRKPSLGEVVDFNYLPPLEQRLP